MAEAVTHPNNSEKASDQDLIRRLWRDYLAPQRGLILLAATYMAIYAAATSAYVFVIQIVIDAATEDGSVTDYAKLVLPVALGVPLISATTNYLQRLATNKIALTAVANMQTNMFDAVLAADLATVSKEPSGTLISRFISDVGVVSNALIR
ncbi:MAG: ABC transporter transmembrane domain-containing protein, partial [Pseudomonadota bacterium]